MKCYTLFLIIACTFLLGSTATFAQSNRAQDRNENVAAAKVAYITDQMDLSAEQSQKFWPIYNEYEAKRRALIKAYRSGYRKNVDELSEQEADARINEMFSTKERELALEKEYASKYQKIITNKQLILLYRAERDFTKLLLQRLDNNRRAQN